MFLVYCDEECKKFISYRQAKRYFDNKGTKIQIQDNDGLVEMYDNNFELIKMIQIENGIITLVYENHNYSC